MRIFLFLHLTGAAVMAVLMIFSVLALLKKWVNIYDRLALGIGLNAGWLFITGSLFSLLTIQHGDSQGLLGFCGRALFYFSVVLLMEAVLLFARKHKKGNLNFFPFKTIATSLSFSFLAVVFTILTLST